MKSLDLPGPSSGSNPENRDGIRNIIKTVMLIVLITGSLALIRFSPLGYYLDPANLHLLQGKLAGFHSLAPVIFFAAGALLIAMGAPRSVIHILAGMIFGFFTGMFVSTAAAFSGSIVIFWLTRLLGRPFFRQKIGNRLKALEGHLESNGFLVVVILRQLPLTSMIVSILIGLTSVNTTIFVLGSLVGLLPEAVIFSLFGSSVRGGFTLRVSVASVLLVLLIVSLRVYLRRSPLARELSQKLTKEKA